MKRHLLVLVTLLTFSGALAQSSYFGLQLSGILGAGSVFPFFELQGGGPVAENVELRVSGLPLLLVNFLQIDLFYSYSLSDTLRGYAGGGADVLQQAFTEGVVFGLHGTAGVEYRTGSVIGLFIEAQPIFVISGPDIGAGSVIGKLNTGVNFHF